MSQVMSFKKVMVANRGEIAIRVFRACTELGIKTLAIYSHEDRLAIHRYKADEAYQVGKKGQPIQSYLDQDEIISLALKHHCDAIHPGYGFLAENAEFAIKCKANNLIFIGPDAQHLEIFGDKTSSRSLALKAGAPVIPGTDDYVKTHHEAAIFAKSHGYPVMLKAAFGGGGRGIRIIHQEHELENAFELASKEAKTAFGRGELFCEKVIPSPRHIEVQILGDNYGNLVHLHERDCSVQRRHQKLVEMAPAISISKELREKLFTAALKITRQINYQNAGTVEFLVDAEERFYFIEVNPRIQVEHTVTECVTNRDLIQAQIRIAEGHALNSEMVDMANQNEILCNGVAVQCRITTEDPAKGFLPDTGKLLTYRSASGFGIRLDAGTGGAGTIITPHYDPLIVKLTAHGRTAGIVKKKMIRSLKEFRIRGVKTNIPFLENVLNHPDFLIKSINTTFIDLTPELFKFPLKKDRANKLLYTIAHTIVNGPPCVQGVIQRPLNYVSSKTPDVEMCHITANPAMSVFNEKGAKGLSDWLLKEKKLWLTDTTFRDAHQSLLATRVRTKDLLAIAPTTSMLAENLFSLEMWGGATFDVAYRFLKEDPWERLHKLRQAIPNIFFQMLLRGSNAVGYTNYPDNVVRQFVDQSAKMGIDVFRIFDALNWLPNMRVAMDAVNNAGKIVEASICYTGDISDPSREKYDLKYYVQLAKDLEKAGAHILAIKDMAGLLKPYAAKKLISTLKNEVGLPLHLHTHDTSGNGLSTYLMAIEAGVDVVDCALSSMSGLTSQPSLNSLLATLKGHPREPAMEIRKMQDLSNYWESVRELYGPFETELKSSTAEVYTHEIPGGQYSNLKPRVIQLGLGERWEEVKQKYHQVNMALGDLIKVTPSSKVVADFAMFLVQNDVEMDQVIARAPSLNFPQSVIDFFAGKIGQPYQGFPKDLQAAVLKGVNPLTERVGQSLNDYDFDSAGIEFEPSLSKTELLSHALYPAVFGEYRKYVVEHGDQSLIPTLTFLYGMNIGEEVVIEIESGKNLDHQIGGHRWLGSTR